jgi:hypothetical protein
VKTDKQTFVSSNGKKSLDGPSVNARSFLRKFSILLKLVDDESKKPTICFRTFATSRGLVNKQAMPGATDDAIKLFLVDFSIQKKSGRLRHVKMTKLEQL